MRVFWQLIIFLEHVVSKLREKKSVILTSYIFNASNLKVLKVCVRQHAPPMSLAASLRASYKIENEFAHRVVHP